MNSVPNLLVAVFLTALGPSSASPMLNIAALRWTALAPHLTPPGSPAERVDSLRIDRARPALEGPEFVMSIFDDKIVGEFRRAWDLVRNGNSPYESVVLILRAAGGGYIAVRRPITYEYKRCTFAWHPATVAVVHTHPNDCPANPQPDDIKIADDHHVLMFTLTNRGMFLYDPATRKTTRVIDGLNWRESDKWRELRAFKK